MKKPAWLLVFPLLASPLYAADLMQVYREAQDNDPTFAAARATLEAGREKTPQARAGLLPSLTLSGNTVWNDNDIKLGTSPTRQQRYNGNGYQLSLTQPLFRWQNSGWVSESW
jgi:outer membrane protein